MSGHKPWAEVKAAREEPPDEWPPKRARSMEDWDAYWARQRWDRRLIHEHVSPFLFRWKERLLKPRLWAREVKWFIQRGRRGWADHDTWGMDSYITRVLGEMTAHMNTHRHGHPCQGITDCWRSTPDNPRTCTCEQDWNDTLTRISAGLSAYNTHWDVWKTGTDSEQDTERNRIISEGQDALRLLADHLPNMWD